MSEIIHRGREINGKTWYKGYYVQYHDNVAGKDVGYILTSDGQGMPPGFGSFAWNAVDPATVGRYIGRTDTYGNKMFEGDIIKYDDWCGVVVFDNDDAQFVVRFTDGDVENFCNLCSGDCEVIGNIYDNPELFYEGET